MYVSAHKHKYRQLGRRSGRILYSIGHRARALVRATIVGGMPVLSGCLVSHLDSIKQREFSERRTCVDSTDASKSVCMLVGMLA